MSSYKERYSDEKIQEAIDKSNSVSAILRNLGLDNVTCKNKRKWIQSEIDSGKFNFKKYKQNQKKEHPFASKSKDYIEDKDYFTKGDTRKAGYLIKKRLLRLGWEDKCSICGQLPEHNGKELVLQVDHINGDGTDNRLENLHIICPNCHSQSLNFAGRNKKTYKNNFIKKEHICECGNKMSDKSKKCKECDYKDRAKNIPEKTQLIIDKEELKTYTSISKKYNVSPTSVKKWFKKYNLI